MAVAGGGIPSIKIKLVNGLIHIDGLFTNKPSSIVEQDLESAYHRLIAGESFEMHCNGIQLVTLTEMLEKRGVRR